jgi:hypothetical protein
MKLLIILLFNLILNVFSEYNCNFLNMTDSNLNMNRYDKLLTEMKTINNKLDLIIKFRGMNKADKEIKEDIETSIKLLLYLISLVFVIVILVSLLVSIC